MGGGGGGSGGMRGTAWVEQSHPTNHLLTPADRHGGSVQVSVNIIDHMKH